MTNMSAADDLIVSLGLSDVRCGGALLRDSSGNVFEASGASVVCASAEMMRRFRHVIEAERPGAWSQVLKSTGQACGRTLASRLDAQLATLGKPTLAGLPLEACLVFLERTVAAQGWGRLSLDLTHAAEHGLVIATLEQSYFSEALPATNVFSDAFVAGLLQAFFEHVSGQVLGCEEIACRSRGAPHCTFVITAADRLAPMLSLVGREPAEAIIARLRR